MERDRNNVRTSECIVRTSGRDVCTSSGGRNLRRGVASLLSLLCVLSLHAQTLRFQVALTYNANPVSAMLILKNEGEMFKGSMVNEFGVNFVEFTVIKEKAKIVRLNPMLKKPFLKKVLRKDFELITRCLTSEVDGVVWGNKGGIYRAFCVKQTDEETKLLSLHLEHQKLPLTIFLSQF